VDMVDVFTNLVTKLPDNLATYVTEAVLGIVKLLAYTAEKSLAGLAAMGTLTYIKKVLNNNPDKSPALYGAATANYDPDPNSPHAFFAAALNAVVDRTFTLNNKALGNDLVVPCDGVYAQNGHPSFPIADPLVYSSSDYVYHTSFFEQSRTIEHMNAFLETTDATPAGAYQVDLSKVKMVREEIRMGTSETVGGAGNGGAGNGGTRLWSAERSGGGLRGGFRRKGQPRSTESGARNPVIIPPEKLNMAEPGEAATAEVAMKESPTRTLPATEVKRQPEISFHERVTEAEPNELIVSLKELAQQAQDVDKQIGIAFAAGENAVTVHVILSAAGFDVEPTEAPMTVKRERDPESERVKFMMTAHSPGMKPIRRVIHADFFLNNSLIGSVSHATVVVPKNYTGAGADGHSKSDGFSLPVRPREECEWVLIVVGESPTYQVLLNSTIPGDTYVARDMGKLQMQEADLAKYLNDILAAQFDAYPNDRVMTPAQFKKEVAAWQQSFMTTVEKLGVRLWQWLPQAFRDEYFKHQRAGSLPRSILIHSDEMIFPWELLVPNEVLNGKVTQAKPPGLTMKPPLQTLKVRRFRVLNPNYPPADALPWAVEEVKTLKKLFPKLVSAVIPSDLQSVQALFKESDVQILHFSGHGEIEPNPDLNKILLDNNVAFTALNLAGSKLCAEAQPVVYMNACSVGNVGVAVGRAGGFASNFVENGCSGVIAPFWPINDRRSMDFAIALYGKLKLGRAIGEALQELRDENADDPTFHAYAYFGDPWVRLTLN
jgi:CHAT domain